MNAFRLSMLVVGLLIANQAAAQDHSQHKASAQPTEAEEEAARTDAKSPTQSQPDDSASEQTEEDHSGMDHSGMDHSGMDHSGMDHSGMDHQAGPSKRPADASPITPIPLPTEADRAAAVRPVAGHPAHDDQVHSLVVFNRLEAFDADGGTGFEWEGQAWIGKDQDKLWLRSEGERIDGHTESADLEVLYGRAVAPWWDVVVGVRHDFRPGPGQDFLAVGVMGLAPYKFEASATGYVGESGQTAARVEIEYEALLSSRLILQPLMEINAHGRNDEARGIGSGLSSAEFGLRLRYEVHRQFAPYIGIVHERAFGNTADLRRDRGEAESDTRWVAGVRVWF